MRVLSLSPSEAIGRDALVGAPIVPEERVTRTFSLHRVS
jgi:hypothetical protein